MAHYRVHHEPRSSHQQILRRVKQLGRFPLLDVGAAQGILGQLLQGSDIVADAVEPHLEWASACTPFYRKVFCSPIETADLPAGEYKIVVCADVLEHTADPVAVLKRLRQAATSDAVFLVSVPNIAHLSIRLMLLAGYFPKMQRGILDQTHLQFLTRTTAEQMLNKAGLKVQRISATPFPAEELCRSGPTSGLYHLVSQAQRPLVATMPRLFAMQFIFEATAA